MKGPNFVRAILTSCLLTVTCLAASTASANTASETRDYTLTMSSDSYGSFAHGHVILGEVPAASVRGVYMYGTIGQIRFTPFPDQMCQTNILPSGNGTDIYFVCWNPNGSHGYPFPMSGQVEILHDQN